jgi:hypothetical protein
LGKNFFAMPTLEGGIPKWIFPLFLWGVTFWGRIFGEKNLRKVVPLFFEPIFWGKKFATKPYFCKVTFWGENFGEKNL